MPRTVSSLHNPPLDILAPLPSMASWAELPHDLIPVIAKRIKVMEDFIAFGAVCTSCRTAATKDNFDLLSPQLPLLMLADRDDDYREFYSLSKEKVSRIFLPEARGRECFLSEGWLFTMSCNGEFNLLHPFSRNQIQLPSRQALSDFEGLDEVPKGQIYRCIDKAILSANPSHTSDYVLVISYFNFSNCLAFWRPGDLNWTNMDTRNFGGAVATMNYYKGQFFAVFYTGEVRVFDVAGPSIAQPIVKSHFLVRLKDEIFDEASVQFYLVELHGALLLVTRFAHHNEEEDGYDTFKFKLSELDVIKRELRDINDLGDSTIILGRNGASSIDSSKFKGVKPNHIYFTDDWVEEFNYVKGGGGRDMGAYDLEDGKIESFYPGLSLSRICPPTWVIPSFR
ncbi:probable F-box protein At4g22060 [Nicotiana tomentosiformis]|uniref:probable F-box protein At4g22060 n=1 Tax=Nicotiana tomentosiformis TaxID=4098 RepID=UPI00051B3B2D|nr:uncharacterized protein LOC104098586 [Nicotiana tomentosiformis]XP_009603653.1 uncharacterized protein LOC104098586 [Nicotiana tomentosiformis]XP_009603656.1 uncharacterized protein LOC104098586 [Nicotiana tomentosiformis]XP_009603658.1 uncharacterized protein LOC104098586 [Nicotiana tomentosiformis]XP_009603661.1 uncharacterized protein LOC104098586 [Nicotiana tomentosiformis]XP_018627108.1 uncharacterized protein LOC104098586 [Nicotiana tomentosiformis]XP_033512637.1 uncharacterized prot